MTAFSYNPKDIERGIEAIRAAHNKIDEELDRLETRTEAKLSVWQGDAKIEYYAHKAKWDANVDEMKRIMISQAIPALERILENYDWTEKLNTKNWRDG